jgi:thioredoxin 1
MVTMNLRAVAIVSLLMFVSGGKVMAAQGDNTISSDTVAVKRSVEKTILFFMNPSGAPCQMQDKILTDMGKSLTDHAVLHYVKTTVPSDRGTFAEYGIRALPSLIIIDSNRKVIKRFPPGIQSVESIRQAIK